MQKKDEDEYDIALDFHGYGYFMTAYVAKCIKAKYKCLWFHDEKLPGVHWIESYLKYFDKFFCVSDSVKVCFDKQYECYKNKSEVFHNLIDKAEIISRSEKVIDDPKFNGDFIILSVGRLVNQKGYDLSVKTASILKEKGYSFKWFIIGEGEEFKNLTELIYIHGLRENFFCLEERTILCHI